jgi:hypothetical protein
VGVPKLCAAGSYSTITRREAPCGAGEGCYINYYCPDPGIMLGCPQHTNSAFKSTSQLDCRCDFGFQCFYKKQVNLNMVLHVPMGVWVSESGKRMRDMLMQAVAEAAGVSIGDVQVDQVLPYMGGAGSRRLLDNGKGALILKMTLRGAEAVRDDELHARLAEILLPRRMRFPQHTGARRIANVHWARADRVHVKPSKIWAKKSQW